MRRLLVAVALGTRCLSIEVERNSGPEEAENPLASLEPVHVGFTRWIDIGDERTVEVQTLAIRPPLFHIKGLLSSMESQGIIDEAQARRTLESKMGGTLPEDTTKGIRKKQGQVSFLGFRKMFKKFDTDCDGALNKKELARLLHIVFDLPNHDHELFMKRYNFTSPRIWERSLFNIDLLEHRQWIMTNYPYMMQRHSDQAWLPYNSSTTQAVAHRAEKITGLPNAIVTGEQALQVLHYGKLGHYSCHYDSPPSHIPSGTVVRLGTMAVFLNDPEAGGQIAFPGADRMGTDKWNMSDWGDLKSECQATDRCTTLGGVVVSPKKGDAILWYNMKLNHWSTNAKGGFTYHSNSHPDHSFQWNSLHCGAEVSKGEKWMANMWFRAFAERKAVSSTIDAPSTVIV